MAEAVKKFPRISALISSLIRISGFELSLPAAHMRLLYRTSILPSSSLRSAVKQRKNMRDYNFISYNDAESRVPRDSDLSLEERKYEACDRANVYIGI